MDAPAQAQQGACVQAHSELGGEAAGVGVVESGGDEVIDILITVAAILAWMVACMAGLALVVRVMDAKPREHDPRMNVPQMVATVWARWLDHKEWGAQHDTSANTVAQVQPAQLVEPVKRGLLPEPEYIDGEIVYSEAQRRAVVRFAQDRSMTVRGE